MKLRHLPNLICIARILLIFPIIGLLVETQFGWALVVFSIAAISDGVDGFLAKHFGWTSPLGSLLDPLADKLLLISVYVTCGILALIPSWLVTLVILRDVIIAAGAFVYHCRIEPIVGQPLFSSKVNTVMQFILIITVVVDVSLIPISESLITFLIGGVLSTTVWSGTQYIYLWFSRARYRIAWKSGAGPSR